MGKKCWKSSYEYRRILEILDSYWLTEPEEDVVKVKMYFRHKNGQTQNKYICWKNPDSAEAPKLTSIKPASALELMLAPSYELIANEVSDFFETDVPKAETYAALLQAIDEFKRDYPDEATEGVLLYMNKKLGKKNEQQG